jgi:hypothetical protein
MNAIDPRTFLGSTKASISAPTASANRNAKADSWEPETSGRQKAKDAMALSAVSATPATKNWVDLRIGRIEEPPSLDITTSYQIQPT